MDFSLSTTSGIDDYLMNTSTSCNNSEAPFVFPSSTPSTSSLPAPEFENINQLPEGLRNDPFVIYLWGRFNNLWSRFNKSHDINCELMQKISIMESKQSDLRDRFDELKDRYTVLSCDHETCGSMVGRQPTAPPRLLPFAGKQFSVGPGDSISQAAASDVTSAMSSTLIPQPDVRPEEYPHSILWDFEDTRTDPIVNVKESNKSRPSIIRSIRTKQGIQASNAQWRSVKNTATDIIRDILHPLIRKAKLANHPPPYGGRYFKENHPKYWETALARLEYREPLVALCSHHWKARHVFKAVFELKDGKEHGLKLDQSSQPTDSPPTDEGPLTSSSSAGFSKRKMDLPHGSVKKRKMSNATDSDILDTSAPHSSTATLPPMSTIDPPTAAIPPVPIPTIEPVFGTSSSNAMGSKIDISGLGVAPSYETLKGFFIEDISFQTIPHALELLEALATSPDSMHTGLASDGVREFLLGIETADPNSPDVGEDDTDTAWGHGQFRTGEVKFNNLTWEGVANRQTAYRILAATLKTCRVARHLCFRHNVPTNGGYLADMYLEKIVQCLWDYWKTNLPSNPSLNPNSTLSSPSSVTVPGHSLDVEEVRSKLQSSLTISELRVLLKTAEVPSANLKKKEEYVNAVIQAAVVPSDEEIEFIISNRKKNKAVK